jgi:gluconokinase
VVFACSALKRIYRDRLRAGRSGVKLIHLRGDEDLIAGRMTRRTDHFMPAGLLRSQMATLEPPAPDEGALTLDVASPPDALVKQCIAWLGLDPYLAGPVVPVDPLS